MKNASNIVEPTLEFDHNIIEHLGIKLYQNKPVNVFSELVSNSWDADAENVWISISESTTNTDRFISVADDGCGMSFSDIQDKYLVIGLQKRDKPDELTERDRKPMGRKGIGKLAPFGIASRVDVISVHDSKLNWFTIELDGLRKVASEKSYKPNFPILQRELEFDLDAIDEPYSKQVRNFISRIRAKKQGTLVLMSGLTPNQLPTTPHVMSKLTSRFTVILARNDFTVFVEDQPITAEKAIPSFELRIPSEGFAEEKVGENTVRYWAGFFAKAETATDEAGVGVYAHGKIAQDRPFYFKSTGKEVFQRYLYAVVEADWLDEVNEDLVSTDRTSISWEHPSAAPLSDWGRKKVGEWLTAYDKHRKSKSLNETSELGKKLRGTKAVLNFSEKENSIVDRLVSDATESIPKSQLEKSRTDLLSAVAKAWANEPTRDLLSTIWKQYSANSKTDKSYSELLSLLEDYTIPESMGLAMTFAQRAYAITLLTQLVNRRSEKNLQELIAVFPWIIEPNGDLLTADQSLKTTMEKAADRVKTLDNHDEARVFQTISPSSRADFVYLTDGSEKTIHIVELKAPGAKSVGKLEERQLVAYLDFTESLRPAANIRGTLIGNTGNGVNRYNPTDRRVSLKSWDEVLLESRNVYTNLLAAMIEKAEITPDDSRLSLIRKFGGEEVWELLNKLAEKSDALKSTMDRLQHLIDSDEPA